MSKKAQYFFRFLVIVIALLFAACYYKYFNSSKSKIHVGRAYEISHKLGYFRDGLELIAEEKRLEHIRMLGGAEEGELFEEINSLHELLKFPDQKDVIVKIYSPNGEAKTISDNTVTSFVVSSDTGWTLATISLKEEK